MCDEIIYADAKSFNEEAKTVPTTFDDKKRQFVKLKIFVLYLQFC